MNYVNRKGKNTSASTNKNHQLPIQAPALQHNNYDGTLHKKYDKYSLQNDSAAGVRKTWILLHSNRIWKSGSDGNHFC
jgi:hypothetical protein